MSLNISYTLLGQKRVANCSLNDFILRYLWISKVGVPPLKYPGSLFGPSSSQFPVLLLVSGDGVTSALGQKML